MSIAPRPQLLTYPDSLGGDLATLGAHLTGPLSGLFHGVHILPPFPSSADRGFAPLTYARSTHGSERGTTSSASLSPTTSSWT